jgi:segregation and condensation protein A
MSEFAADAMPGGRDVAAAGELVLDLDGYEGPIDLLLSLARAQKVDLARISILALADQYLDFIAAQRRLDLAVAADYLVMAAVLTYLKSCLLLPPAPTDDEPAAAELAEILRHRLALLEAMQGAGRRLLARPLFGRDFFFRGAPEASVVAVPRWDVGLYELLRAYGENHRRRTARVLAIAPSAYHSTDEALRRLARLLGRMTDWRELSSLLPAAPGGAEFRRSAVAATLAASLELARDGRAELRQDQAFGPIWLRRRDAARAAAAGLAARR